MNPVHLLTERTVKGVTTKCGKVLPLHANFTVWHGDVTCLDCRSRMQGANRSALTGVVNPRLTTTTNPAEPGGSEKHA